MAVLEGEARVLPLPSFEEPFLVAAVVCQAHDGHVIINVVPVPALERAIREAELRSGLRRRNSRLSLLMEFF